VSSREPRSEREGPRKEAEEEERKPFLLRLPPSLLADLRGWAEDELRSLNGHLEFLLREAVKRRKRVP
jgi:hypothetical protein